MKIALVGGLGYLGASMAEMMAAEGWDVIVVARRSSLRVAARRSIEAHFRRVGVHIAYVDSISVDTLRSIAPDSFVHVAGKISGSYRVQREAHVELLERVVNAASEIGARVVYISSILAYGRVKHLGRGSVALEEDEHLAGERLHRSNHSRTKAEGERILVSRGGELGGRWAILRPGLLLGRWAYHFEWRYAALLSKARVYPSIKAPANAVYTGDVARAAIMGCEGRLDGMWVHVVNPGDYTVGDVYSALCRSLSGGKCLGLPVYAPWGILSSILPPSLSLSAVSEALSLGYRFSTRILVGFSWTPLEDAVLEMAEWLKKGS